MKVSQFGRSMVEMIGVLAIIGVLSVGAIAGYSKAMLKYKLNKQSAQYNQLLATVYKYDGQWGIIENFDNMIPMLKSLNEIPKEMINNTESRIYDIFHNELTIYYSTLYSAPVIWIHLDLKETGNSMEICRNAFITVKEWHENMFVMESFGTSSEGNQNLQSFGDSHCIDNRKCLVDLSLKDIDNLCHAQLGRDFTIRIFTADHR
ncbi:MAG: hypothetical protein IJ019_06580 [Alphaproteobacteria bacterium]|nr:hypothetical protein [Alphaproteobacteria bacterium]